MTRSNSDAHGLVGGNILSLITCGIHTNPLVIYREYIQNAADSIASSNKSETGTVEITIDPSASRINIRDNGPGLPPDQIKRELVPIARSRKHRKFNRGFRGIGRLSGLAFGSSVSFLTRHQAISPVTRMVWNGDQLRKEIGKNTPVEEAILKCIAIDQLDGDNYPENFFEVQIDGISRHVASSILNRDFVREYIGKVCPVHFKKDFAYRENFLSLFQRHSNPLTLDIYFSDEKEPITRPHGKNINLSNGRQDDFLDFDEIKIPALDNDNCAAIGWIAHSSYLGALPKKSGIECMRARVGNIQIGDEAIFDHLFTESRLNRWCVAEIHILDTRIVPNGERDYFEPSPHVRNLENHLSAVCRKLERRCRNASGERNRYRQLQKFLESSDDTYSLATSGYLPVNTAKGLIEEKLLEITRFIETAEHQKLNKEEMEKLYGLEKQYSHFRANKSKFALNRIDSPDMSAYKDIFKIISEVSPSPRAAKEMIESILAHLGK